jgi:hypothetical protein
VEDNKGMLKIVVDYYKNLFGFEKKLDIDLVDNFMQANEKVTREQNKCSMLILLNKRFRMLSFALMLKELLVLMDFLFFFINTFGNL